MNARALPRPLTADGVTDPRRGEQGRSPRPGLSTVLGAESWLRLPEAVRERFADHAGDTWYAGAFECVHASRIGQAFAWMGALVGTPVAPRTGENVEARVHVFPDAQGVTWVREYRWPDGRRDCVTSTKVVTADHQLVEKLPARLCMPLRTYEDGGVVHFVSLGYYFDLGFGLRLWLPALLTPGVTHVEHIDLDHGWFRFTMTVTHPWLGETFFQTGRFCALDTGLPEAPETHR
jgi:hypothetical protein